MTADAAKTSSLPKQIGTVESGAVKVVLVDGDVVKTQHDMDFIEGGNGERYGFIPKDEIWLDDSLEVHDLPFILYHEATERRLMSRGMDYDNAHEQANIPERTLRMRFPENKALSWLAAGSGGALVKPPARGRLVRIRRPVVKSLRSLRAAGIPKGTGKEQELR